MSRHSLIFAPAALLAALPAIAAEPVRPLSSKVQVAQMAVAAAQPAAPKPAQSLYDRVGGIFAIAAVVDRFSDAIIKNPKLNQNPALVAWNRDEAAGRLPGLKVMRTLWIASVAGGPFQYTGKPLADAHPRFKLTEAEFKEVGAEIVRALEFYKVPQKEQQELVKAYNSSMADVVTETP
jgi:hemoglobin